MAVVATVTIDGVGVQLASAHLENRTDAGHRAEQMEALLRRSTRVPEADRPSSAATSTRSAPPTPSCSTGPRCAPCGGRDPTRFTWPVPYEPLFDVARAHGFEWTEANVAAPTTEHDAVGRPDHVPIKLDWLLVRGLVARRPAVVAAGGLSDHNLVSVGVRRR